MKKLNVLLIIFIAALTFQACKKDNETNPGQSNQTIQPTPKKAYEKRWEVSDPAQRLAFGSLSNIIAIEFMYDSYVIFFSSGNIHSGNYKEINANTLELEDYGLLIINTLNEKNFGFTLQLDDEEYVITSAAAAKIASSSRTEALCNTWKILNTFTEYEEDIDFDEEVYVTFSAYGTYLVKSLEKNGEVINIRTNTWMWTNSAETDFCYGNWNGSNISACNNLNTVSVTLLENNTKCIIKENVFGDLETYELIVQ